MTPRSSATRSRPSGTASSSHVWATMPDSSLSRRSDEANARRTTSSTRSLSSSDVPRTDAFMGTRTWIEEMIAPDPLANRTTALATRLEPRVPIELAIAYQRTAVQLQPRVRLEGASVGRHPDVQRRLLPRTRQHHLRGERLRQACRLGDRPRDRLDRPPDPPRRPAARRPPLPKPRRKLLHARERQRPERDARQRQPACCPHRQHAIGGRQASERSQYVHRRSLARRPQRAPRATPAQGRRGGDYPRKPVTHLGVTPDQRLQY